MLNQVRNLNALQIFYVQATNQLFGCSFDQILNPVVVLMGKIHRGLYPVLQKFRNGSPLNLALHHLLCSHIKVQSVFKCKIQEQAVRYRKQLQRIKWHPVTLQVHLRFAQVTNREQLPAAIVKPKADV